MKQQPTYEVEESTPPLDECVALITLMVKRQRLLANDVVASPVIHDLEAILGGKTVMGFQTRWARRVAIPILRAHQALKAECGTPQTRGRVALHELEACGNEPLRVELMEWVRKTHYVE